MPVSRKAWLKERFPEGHTFKKFDVGGKVFIEYVPAEYAGSQLKLQVTISSSASGLLDVIKERVTDPDYWKNVKKIT